MVYDKKARERGETELEQLHIVLLEILKVVDDICRRHKLTYWLDAGNLLGHVRHGGFIPWDDDIDLCMPREDYDQFIKIAPKELPKDLFFQHRGVDKKKCKWVKIRDNYSTVEMSGELDKNIEHHQGIFLDIFPYDILEEEFKNTKMVVNRKFQRSKNPVVRNFKWLINPLTTIPVKAIGMKRLQNFFLKKHSGNNPQYVSTGFEISNLYFTFDYDSVFPLQEIEFVGVKTYAPNNIDQYLTDMYGDYMTIPKKDNQMIHAFVIKPFTKCNHPAALDY